MYHRSRDMKRFIVALTAVGAVALVLQAAIPAPTVELFAHGRAKDFVGHEAVAFAHGGAKDFVGREPPKRLHSAACSVPCCRARF